MSLLADVSFRASVCKTVTRVDCGKRLNRSTLYDDLIQCLMISLGDIGVDSLVVG